MRLVRDVLQLAWLAFVLLTPLLGVWLASSLVAFYEGPRELAVAGGVLLFPALPLLWEWRAAASWSRKREGKRQLAGKPKRAGTFVGRLTARTLALNLAFLALLLGGFPKVAFSALATRGDWFLSGKQDSTSRALRGAAFAAASGLEWLHRLANPNPWKKEGDLEPVPATVTPTVEERQREPIARRWIPGTAEWAHAHPTPPQPEPEPVEPEVEPTRQQPPPPPPPQSEPTWQVGETSWPQAPVVHPVVAAMTAADESSLEAVARFIAAREKDPFQRVKALHDWVVTRLHYDHASLEPTQRKPQDAQSVFVNRLGVCEGYARLLVALGKVSGDNIVFVVGDVRNDDGRQAPIGHAWNAVELAGQWYLIDATWDDPTEAGKVTEHYRTDYLFIPPSVAIFDHFPEQARWQLLAKPLARGDFLRQQQTGPALAREGLELVAPSRAEVEVEEALEVVLDNPLGRYLTLTLHGPGERGDCGGKDNAARVTLRCEVPGPGRYVATVFANREPYGNYDAVARLQVQRTAAARASR